MATPMPGGDNAVRLAAFLRKLGTDPKIAEMREEIQILFPGITQEEWMRGFAIHDETVIQDMLEINPDPKAVAAAVAEALAERERQFFGEPAK